MTLVVAASVMSMSFTARLGRGVSEATRLDAVAGAVALALTTGDRAMGELVASANGVRIIEVQLRGDALIGFDAMVTVADTGGHGRARASTQDDSRARASTQDDSRARASTGFAPTIPVSGESVLR